MKGEPYHHDDINVLFDLGKKVHGHSDYVAISTYPNWIVPGMKIKEANPDHLPRDWFAQWTNLAPDKPFLVAEIAYPAEDLKMGRVFWWRVKLEANENWQARYAAFMLEELNNLDAVFVALFVRRDYDALYDWIREQVGEVEFFKTWLDTGFLKGEGEERPSLGVWDSWLALPRTDD